MRSSFCLGLAIFACLLGGVQLTAAPINPEVYKKKYEDARKDAAVVAQVRVLAVVCTEMKGEGRERSATLQVTLQVLDNEKGPIKKNDVLVVAHKVNLPAGPGPGSYGFWAALRQFPTTAGVKGAVALNWDKETNRYTAVAGWVPEPNMMPSAIPTEVGKAFVAGDAAPPK
jgi:hypothetical protein